MTTGRINQVFPYINHVRFSPFYPCNLLGRRWTNWKKVVSFQSLRTKKQQLLTLSWVRWRREEAIQEKFLHTQSFDLSDRRVCTLQTSNQLFLPASNFHYYTTRLRPSGKRLTRRDGMHQHKADWVIHAAPSSPPLTTNDVTQVAGSETLQAGPRRLNRNVPSPAIWCRLKSWLSVHSISMQRVKNTSRASN